MEQQTAPEKVDVSGYKTAAGAAKATAKALRKWAEFYGHDADDVVLYNPDETNKKRDMHGDIDCWTVAWEGGPNEWATALTGGESLLAHTEFGSYGNDPQVSGLLHGDGFNVECYYSFDIQFFNN